MTQKVPCKKCGTMILPATVNKTGGFCMPCYKQKSNTNQKEFPSPESISQKATERGRAMPWYYTSSDKPTMEQVVIDPGTVEFKESKRMLMLTALYLRIYQSFWISVLLKLDDADCPIIVIKANESTSFLKDHPFKIGFSFIKGRWGNLFALFVEFDGPCPYNCPSKPLVFFEDIFGLDFDENRSRLLRNLDTERFHIWLAEGGNATIRGDIMEADPVEVKYTATIDVEPACRAKLNELAARHIDEHLKIGKKNWNFQRSSEKFSADMPITRHPILPRPGIESTAADVAQTSPSLTATTKSYLDERGEREAQHVVIFVGGDPGWTVLPQSVQSFIFKEAQVAGVVLTNVTEFHVYRKSDDSVARVRKGESVGIIAVTELAIKLGKQMQMVDDYLQKKILVKEIYCPRSGSFFKRTPDCAVVMICG